MLYRQRFEADVEDCRTDIDVISAAVRELQDCHGFKSILAAVLSLGNALNISTSRGDARGFRLEALAKLRDTKCFDAPSSGCPTLLHYLARKLRSLDADLLDFLAHAPHVDTGARSMLLFASLGLL